MLLLYPCFSTLIFFKCKHVIHRSVSKPYLTMKWFKCPWKYTPDGKESQRILFCGLTLVVSWRRCAYLREGPNFYRFSSPELVHTHIDTNIPHCLKSSKLWNDPCAKPVAFESWATEDSIEAPDTINTNLMYKLWETF